MFSPLTTHANSSAVKVKVTGIDDKALNENIRIYLNQINQEEADGSERHRYIVQQTIENSLRALGYFNNQINFDFQPQQNTLITQVTLSQPIVLADPQIEIKGDALQDEAFNKLNQQIPATGKILNQSHYDDYKSSLQALAARRGYFDADFERSRLLILLDEQQAIWDIIFNSGTRYHYGDITFKDSQIREDYLRPLLPIKPSDPYKLNDLLTLTSNYNATNWFRSVLLEPTLIPEKHQVDFNVLLRPQRKNNMELGIGFSTDVGPRLQIGWNRPWINSRGHSFSSNFYLSKPQQNVELNYRIPLRKNPLNYYYDLSAGLEREDNNDTKSQTITLAGLRYWNHARGWQFFTGLRMRYDSFTQADISRNTLLIYPTAGIKRVRIRGGLFPTWADAQNITINVGNQLWGSDINFYSIRGTSSWIRTLQGNHRFLGRVELGYLHSSDLSRIPPALRYFAGGDRSLRGFGYKKISPSNDGKLTGGSTLALANLEYQYQVYPKWWLATFYDTGLVALDFKESNLHSGAGVGVRWASPVGTVKLDIATPLKNRNNHQKFQFYIGLGSEL